MRNSVNDGQKGILDFLKDFRALTSICIISQDRAKSLEIMRLQRLLKLAGGT